MAKTMVKLRAFLNAEAKRNAGGNGTKPTEPVPMKILKPTRYSLYMRLCPFCRKARGKIQSINRKQSRASARARRERTEAGEPSGSAPSVEWEGPKDLSQVWAREAAVPSDCAWIWIRNIVGPFCGALSALLDQLDLFSRWRLSERHIYDELYVSVTRINVARVYDVGFRESKSEGADKTARPSHSRSSRCQENRFVLP